jgi:hypothetical protein
MKRRALPLLPMLLTLPARAATIEAAMQGLAAVRESRAAFREEKVIPELELPLPARGTLSWRAPDRLEKHTMEPVEERLIVEGDRLTIERRDARQVLSLDQSPEIRALVEAIRGTLAGDLPRLRTFYDTRFSDGPGGWRLLLVPHSVRLSAVVQQIEMLGSGAQIRSIETRERGGVTRMLIDPLP